MGNPVSCGIPPFDTITVTRSRAETLHAGKGVAIFICLAHIVCIGADNVRVSATGGVPGQKCNEKFRMPSLFRLLFTLAILAGIVYGAAFALTIFVEPKQREMTVKIPAKRLPQ